MQAAHIVTAGRGSLLEAYTVLVRPIALAVPGHGFGDRHTAVRFEVIALPLVGAHLISRHLAVAAEKVPLPLILDPLIDRHAAVLVEKEPLAVYLLPTGQHEAVGIFRLACFPIALLLQIVPTLFDFLPAELHAAVASEVIPLAVKLLPAGQSITVVIFCLGRFAVGLLL